MCFMVAKQCLTKRHLYILVYLWEQMHRRGRDQSGSYAKICKPGRWKTATRLTIEQFSGYSPFFPIELMTRQTFLTFSNVST
jgi:hypothetical protein